MRYRVVEKTARARLFCPQLKSEPNTQTHRVQHRVVFLLLDVTETEARSPYVLRRRGRRSNGDIIIGVLFSFSF